MDIQLYDTQPLLKNRDQFALAVEAVFYKPEYAEPGLVFEMVVITLSKGETNETRKDKKKTEQKNQRLYCIGC